MPVELNHTVVAARHAETSARWVADVLGLPEPVPFGPFWQIDMANGVGLDFGSIAADDDVVPQHYAFLISEDEFDAVYGRIVERGLDHWADPTQRRPGEINHHDGGRGVYWLSNDGHFLEVITRPYGSGA